MLSRTLDGLAHFVLGEDEIEKQSAIAASTPSDADTDELSPAFVPLTKLQYDALTPKQQQQYYRMCVRHQQQQQATGSSSPIAASTGSVEVAATTSVPSTPASSSLSTVTPSRSVAPGSALSSVPLAGEDDVSRSLPPPSFDASQVILAPDSSSSQLSQEDWLATMTGTEPSFAAPPPTMQTMSPSLPFPSTLPVSHAADEESSPTPPSVASSSSPSAAAAAPAPATGARGLFARLLNRDAAAPVSVSPASGEAHVEGSGTPSAPADAASPSSLVAAETRASAAVAHAKSSFSAALSSVKAYTAHAKGTLGDSYSHAKENVVAKASSVKQSVAGSVAGIKGQVSSALPLSFTVSTATPTAGEGDEVAQLIHQLQMEESRSQALHKEYRAIIQEKEGEIQKKEDELLALNKDLKLRFREMDAWKEKYQTEAKKNKELEQQLSAANQLIARLQQDAAAAAAEVKVETLPEAASSSSAAVEPSAPNEEVASDNADVQIVNE